MGEMEKMPSLKETILANREARRAAMEQEAEETQARWEAESQEFWANFEAKLESRAEELFRGRSDQMGEMSERAKRDAEYQEYLEGGWRGTFESLIDGAWDELNAWEDGMDLADLTALETMVDTFAREFKARLAELKAERA